MYYETCPFLLCDIILILIQHLYNLNARNTVDLANVLAIFVVEEVALLLLLFCSDNLFPLLIDRIFSRNIYFFIEIKFY